MLKFRKKSEKVQIPGESFQEFQEGIDSRNSWNGMRLKMALFSS
jgi:hypothetical protein